MTAATPPRCPRCRGRMRLEPYIEGNELVCISCGFVRYEREEEAPQEIVARIRGGDVAERILGFLRVHPGSTASEICEGLDLAHSSFQHVMRRLDKQGLVRRTGLTRAPKGLPAYEWMVTEAPG